MINQQDVLFFSEKSKQILTEIGKDIVGQEDTVKNTVIAMIAGGNVLLEGVPGVGKTRLVRSIGRTFSLPFSRIQFTPDLMPADVTGGTVIEKDEQGNNRLTFRQGPIFSNVVLADEINRATPKTQSALLEAMQEHTVTADGKTFRLEEPFFVLATENPIEQDGTYPLPEAQTDRFLFKLTVGFPEKEELAAIVRMTDKTASEQALPVASGEDLLAMRACAKEVLMLDEVLDYAMDLVMFTHPELPCAPEFTKKYLRFGASPRAAQAFIQAGKVRALIEGRFNLSFDDVDALARPVLRHRIKLSYAAVSERITVDDAIDQLILALREKRRMPIPKEGSADRKRKK